MTSPIKSVLVDARSYRDHLPDLKAAIAASGFVGYDLETEDSRRHEGLTKYCKFREDGTKAKTSKTVFDYRRTTICGASFYTELRPDVAFYLNTGHADVENRLPTDVLLELMAAKRPDAFFVAHNAPFERTVMKAVLDYDFDNILCTLQMAVSAYGPHEYSHGSWIAAGQGGIKKLIPSLTREALMGYDMDTGKMSPSLEELVGKVTAKESKADHSWNGFVKEIAYGYGLKQAIRSHFGYQMTTFEEVLGDEIHMGMLTGDQVVDYGADDAFWAVRLMRFLMVYMVQNGGPELVTTFFEQENPMTETFSNIAVNGLRVDFQAIKDRLQAERGIAAEVTRKMKAAVRQLLPFPEEHNASLVKRDSWYAKNADRYRKQIIDWAALPDHADDYQQVTQIRGPVSNGWAEDLKQPEPQGPNLTHYMPMRTLLYDLMGATVIVSQGKTESDGEARGKIRDKLTDENAIAVLDGINQLAGVEQRMKLFLKPYSMLTDPETGRMYPQVSSQLATRRMAASFPNPMQLAKRGESSYIRGFFKPDYDDHLIVSLDWSAIELVLIGEFSGDPEFLRAFGQLPHQDLHSGTASTLLSIECPGMNEPLFKTLKGMTDWDAWLDEHRHDADRLEFLRTNLKGEQIDAAKAYGYWRTTAGKEANFNYWYSGWLATIGERFGWSQQKTADATDAYRQRFWMAEEWRVNKISEVQAAGFITLADGHRYNRVEATQNWYLEWMDKFSLHQDGAEPYNRVMRKIAQQIQKRAGNQTVNADIQGSCATLAKRSERRTTRLLRDRGWGPREFRFMIPIHDELVWSVHKDLVPQFITEAHRVMTSHDDIFKTLKLDSSPAVGRTFEPWNAKKAPFGQIELYEPPGEVVGKELANTRLDEAGIRHVVEYLTEQPMRLAA